MSTKHFIGGLAIGAALVGLGAFIVGGPPIHSAYPYCWQFEPTDTITTIELADIIKIWGGGGGVGSPIKAWGNNPDSYSSTDGPGSFIDRQFKRCDP